MRRTVKPRALGTLFSALLIAGFSTGLGGCALVSALKPPVGGFSTPTGEVVSADIASFYHQVIGWQPCGDAFQCATVTAPRNWEQPDQGEVRLALIRHSAGNGKPLGSLLVNPGGPGESGFDFIADSLDYATDKQLQQNFDVVGFDPRGVDRSNPVECFDDRDMDAYLYDIPAGMRGSDQWIGEQDAIASRFAQACDARTGPELDFVDTVSVARDLDMLRAALGDTHLNYLGYSYGTAIGANYAHLFPQRVGRMVLDGAINPAASSFDMTIAQAQGFENALRAYAADCIAARSECPFTGSVDQAMSRIRELLDNVEAQPVAASDGRKLGASTLTTAIIYPLYHSEAWPALSDMLASVIAGRADKAFQFADRYNGRNPDGSYEDNSTNAFIAVNCLDYSYDDNRAVMRERAAQLEATAPVIGPYMSYGDIQCAKWTKRSDVKHEEIHAPGSPAIMVVGTTNDPATPYQWAEQLARQLENGHLVTYRGEGHTAYNKSTACVNEAVDSYLIDGAVPAADPHC